MAAVFAVRQILFNGFDNVHFGKEFVRYPKRPGDVRRVEHCFRGAEADDRFRAADPAQL
ncbi:hypothetical protein [Amycolatopsis orientalis]|uniref:hypothetical protein n=1 Tax=Amycolatopsis orientalis TaxID=31958 RepID=UPI001319E20E|nr:hypothetical protein [Amycolatopsis orientalis]